MTILLFTVALALSAVAAWYAIAGLVAIFAASALPIVIMGSLLETSKLVIASWLYRNWVEIPKLFKAYFTVALVILMALTSMGIFGFLSKAHLDQAVPTSDVAAQVALIDEKINIQKENINEARKQINQLDSIADQTIARTEDARGVERANQIRRNQSRERTRLIGEISGAQAEIAKLNQEKAPLAKDLRKIEAEVGPIKYIAALIYGDDPDENVLEKSVRFVILMIVVVFDPLAVLMLIAANWQLKRDKMASPNELHFSPVANAKEGQDEPDLVVEPETLDSEHKPEEPTEPPVPEKKDWSKSLYDRVNLRKKIEFDSAGRRITPVTPEELAIQSKAESFLNNVERSIGVDSIERDVDGLQNSQK